MKTFVILIFSAFTLLSANSCNKCSTCRNYPLPDEKLCKKDFASDDSYAAAFRQKESEGYDCE